MPYPVTSLKKCQKMSSKIQIQLRLVLVTKMQGTLVKHTCIVHRGVWSFECFCQKSKFFCTFIRHFCTFIRHDNRISRTILQTSDMSKKSPYWRYFLPTVKCWYWAIFTFDIFYKCMLQHIYCMFLFVYFFVSQTHLYCLRLCFFENMHSLP